MLLLLKKKNLITANLTLNLYIFYIFFSKVSRLVILHEEAEDGNAMPDLERPVQGVSKAVANLVKVFN